MIKSKKIIFLVAMKDEAVYLKKKFDLKINKIYDSNFSEYLVSQKYPNISMLITGIGVSNILLAISSFLNYEKIDVNDVNFINIGYAGSPFYKVGSIVEISTVKRLYEPKKIKNLNKSFDLIPFLKKKKIDNTVLYTADDFVERKELPEKNCVVDMEGYYIACLLPNINIFKIVSDNLSLKVCNKTTMHILWVLRGEIYLNI